MMLDETPVAPTTIEPSAPFGRHAAAPVRRRSTTSLVLFVGRACRPQAAECEVLARAGMRSLWLPGLEQAFEAARLARFDALVVDAGMLEGRDGATLARLRETHQSLVIVLAEHGDEVDEIVALELGADAFLQRPLSPRRLRAHLAVLMRLRGPASPGAAGVPTPVASGPDRGPAACWRLDRIANCLRNGAHAVALTELQCALLHCLIESDGRIVARDRLLATLPKGKAASPRSVDVYLHRLRRRLQDAGVTDWQIEAVRGRGYVLRTVSASTRP